MYATRLNSFAFEGCMILVLVNLLTRSPALSWQFIDMKVSNLDKIMKM